MVETSLASINSQEELHVIENSDGGFAGVIAIHSTALGPAAGGCRLWRYDRRADLKADAARLARGMSYKNAMAGLPFGGGKAVLQHPQGVFDRRALFRVFGEAVAELGGRYVTAEDVGTTVADMRMVRERTRHVAGLDQNPGRAGGDPSPWTALGVFESMKASVELSAGRELGGLTVAVQGTGNVGAGLCRLLRKAGAKLIVADVDRRRAETLADEVDARVAAPEDVLFVEADVLAPCALGGALNEKTIPLIKAKLVCGGANNQLATEADGEKLMARGIVYAPDYVVNAGGIINVAAEYLDETTEQVEERVHRIAGRLTTVLRQAQAEQKPTNLVADAFARQIIADAGRRAA